MLLRDGVRRLLKEPLREPRHVLTDLARSPIARATSHLRLIALDNGQVTFHSKDYQRGHRLRTQMLEAVEFLRRLILYVPPQRKISRGYQRRLSSRSK